MADDELTPDSEETTPQDAEDEATSLVDEEQATVGAPEDSGIPSETEQPDDEDGEAEEDEHTVTDKRLADTENMREQIARMQGQMQVGLQQQQSQPQDDPFKFLDDSSRDDDIDENPAKGTRELFRQFAQAMGGLLAERDAYLASQFVQTETFERAQKMSAVDSKLQPMLAEIEQNAALKGLSPEQKIEVAKSLAKKQGTNGTPSTPKGPKKLPVRGKVGGRRSAQAPTPQGQSDLEKATRGIFGSLEDDDPERQESLL